MDDKRHYLEAIFTGLWEFRFLHRDLEHLLSCDAELAGRYRTFSRRCVQSSRNIYQGLIDGGILCAQRTDPETLAVSSWLIMTGWVSFLCTSVLDSAEGELTESMLRRGVYQVVAQELGLLTDAARPAVEALLADYRAPLG